MRACAVTLIVLFALEARAQEPERPPLFATDAPLELTLAADFSLLDGDRRGDVPWRPASVTLARADGTPTTLEAHLRTRGDFRLETCSFPPLRLDVGGADAGGTALEGQDELKIVGACRPGRDSYEQLVLGEYLAYRAYALVTPRSFRVRLARIRYVDTGRALEASTRFAFFLEHEDALAQRLGGRVFELPEGKNLPVAAFDRFTAATAAILEYMIGNADWSDVAAHNVEIVDVGGTALAIPYDFDLSGLLDAPYVVRTADPYTRSGERRYRGWCQDASVTALVLARFRDARAGVVDLYERFPHLDEENRARSLAYLGEFFEAIETDERARLRFLRDCRPVEG